MGFVDFRREIELGGDDHFRQRGAQGALLREPSPLCRGRTGDDDDPVKVRLGLCFKKQRDVHDVPGALTGDFPGAIRPSLADDRMQDLFELPPARLIMEDQRAQSGAVRLSRRVAYVRTESFYNRPDRRIIIGEQVVRTSVRIEKLGRKTAQQQAGE